jgi:hypothetical protein
MIFHTMKLIANLRQGREESALAHENLSRSIRAALNRQILRKIVQKASFEGVRPNPTGP